MKFREGWSSHMVMLVKILQHSQGPVLELGMGLFSTPLLHWMCKDLDRELVSYESEAQYFKMDLDYKRGKHSVLLTPNWDDAQIEAKHWGLAFVDHAPARRRKVEIERLKDIADFVVVHDTQPQDNKFYHYNHAFAKYKYRFNYTKASPNTTVLSNFYDLSFLNHE